MTRPMEDGNFDKRLEAAQGYFELQMFEDAMVELSGLPEAMRESAEAIELEASIFVATKQCGKALARALDLCQLRPDHPAGFIQAAYCLHEMGKTEDARAMLLSGPESMKKDALFHYNLACYDAVLGNLKEALRHLEASFRLEKRLREFALADRDLDPIRASIPGI